MGPLNFSVPLSHDGMGHQLQMRVNTRRHIRFYFSQSVLVLPVTSICRQLFRTDVVIWSYTTVPVAFRLHRSCALSLPRDAVHPRY